MAWEDLLEAVNGKKVTLDGVSGTVKAGLKKKLWGNESFFIHEPDRKGKQSKEYRETRRKLGDDYHTDLSQSERAVDLVYKILGKKKAETFAMKK